MYSTYYFWSPFYEVALVLALILLALSAPSHFSARNTGTILFICWVFVGNLILLVNKFVWSDHLRNVAPIWCDITVHFLAAFHFSIGAASIVINRRLFKISRISSVVVTATQRRKELIIDLAVGLGIPAVGILFHYINQGHRANIIQGVGCAMTIYNTPLAFLLFWMWPCVLSFIAIIYGILSLRAFLKRRIVVEQFLNSNGSGLNVDRYFRLMCFSAVELTVAFPLGLFVLLTAAINKPIFPWISWEDTHSEFNRIEQIPAVFITSTPSNYLYLGINLWAVPCLGFCFFLFFGLGREQINQYKRWFYAILKPFGINPPAPRPYSTDRRTWWQKLLRRPASATSTTNNGTGLTSSRGPTDTLPVFRHNASHISTYPEKPIPSARSRLPQTASLDASLAFDFDEKLDTESDMHPEAMLDVIDVNKALPASPSIVVTTITVHETDRDRNRGGDSDRDRDDEKDVSQARSMLSASSASSVAGSSRRVSAAIRDVELSEADARAMEARVQRMA